MATYGNGAMTGMVKTIIKAVLGIIRKVFSVARDELIGVAVGAAVLPTFGLRFVVGTVRPPATAIWVFALFLLAAKLSFLPN